MKIALLISGTPRTFFFDEQINFFKKLKQKLCSENNSVDVYIFLKLQDVGKYNFFISKVSISKIIEHYDNLNPVYFEIINNFGNEYKNKELDRYKRNYYSIMKPIDILLKKTENIQNYDWFIRIRPDFYLDLSQMKFNFNKKDTNNIYTVEKNKNGGNDQYFIFSRLLYNIWWKKYLSNNIKNIPKNPEYYIFLFINKNNIITEKITYGIVRNYNSIQSWNNNNNRYELVLKDYWLNNNINFKSIDYLTFEKELNKTIKKTNKNIIYTYLYD